MRGEKRNMPINRNAALFNFEPLVIIIADGNSFENSLTRPTPAPHRGSSMISAEMGFGSRMETQRGGIFI